MTALSEATPDPASGAILRRYYVAMSVPFLIDVATSAVYAAIHARPLTLIPMATVSAFFLVLGVGFGAYLLIRPIQRFLAGERTFADIETGLIHLPRRSAILVGCLYAPMVALRLLSPRYGITFGANIEVSAWIDTVATFLVVTGFNVVLSFFVVSAYFEHLCEHVFEAKGVNIGTFRGAFRHKVALALLFVSFAGMLLLAGDIASYEGDRLLREASVDFTASVVGAAVIYYWISRALTRPITRLDHGMHRVAGEDFSVRLPVTSDDEVGHATSGFNQMAAGLAEREYLRDTFGKYVSESVASAILDGQEHTGRAVDTVAEATLMFTDIEGFTSLSEGMPPADVAAVLNTYLATVVPAIQRHGGVVNSFIGDGVFASFNLPLPQEGHAAAALRAALEIQQALTAAKFAGSARLRTRVGINTGPVIGVTIGADNRLSYTLLGDAVNIAARVEQLNKRFDTLILATESTVSAGGAGFTCVRLGETDVRGHQGNVVVYRVDPAA